MSENKRTAPEESVLPAVAALHVFLAAHPGLAALPAYWMAESNDISFAFRGTDPQRRTDIEAIAKGFSVEVEDGGRVESRDGGWVQFLYVHAALHGIPVFGSARLAVDGPEAER
ncbi:hypothetical protein ACFVXG_20495 [Kitasatospora sp. NPDC058162]|uniref:hypothetical protein n=1 Tax=Kitasatospora sp. NPDC058162 TaxID=3346362 RepID=UPI0036DA145F